jgi:hypothetical protein
MPDSVTFAASTSRLVEKSIDHETARLPVSRRAVLLAATSAIAGCATSYPGKLTGTVEGAVITPICLLKNEMPIYDVGTTAFQNGVRSVPVAGWNFAGQVQSLMTERIRASNGKYWATDGVEGDKRRRLLQLLPMGPDGRAELGFNLLGVASVGREMKIDYLLVIDSERLQDPFFGTNQFFSGQGVYQRSHFSFRAGINFLVARASVIDVAKASIVASRTKWQFTPRDLSEWVDPDSVTLPADFLEGGKAALASLADEVAADLLQGLAVV